MRKAYIIYRRAQGDVRVYQVAFWDEAVRAYRVRRSADSLIRALGERGRHLLPTKKADADIAARLALEVGLVGRPSGILLDYLTQFWAPGSAYLLKRESRNRKLSRSYTTNMARMIALHLKPFLEREEKSQLPLSGLTPPFLEAMVQSLLTQGKSAALVNAVRKAVAVPLGEAYRNGLIVSNPASRVESLPDRPPRREILSLEEVRTFFEQRFPDRRYLVANMLAATAGLRLGEIRGLRIEDLRPGYAHVCHNWQNGEGLKVPKWGSIRDVPLTIRVEIMLRACGSSNPWRNGFVFWGERRDHPVSGTMILRSYRATLAGAGISREEQNRRHLTFHAWRHWYNSMMRGKVEDHILRLLTGHRNATSTERYTALPAETIKRVGKLVEDLINEPLGVGPVPSV